VDKLVRPENRGRIALYRVAELIVSSIGIGLLCKMVGQPQIRIHYVEARVDWHDKAVRKMKIAE